MRASKAMDFFVMVSFLLSQIVFFNKWLKLLLYIYIKDINECELSRDNCSSKAECLNTEGSFACKCLKGYRGDGVLCKGNDIARGHSIINSNAE
jgi:hypothetical protein